MKEKVLIWGLGVGFEIRKHDLLSMVEEYRLNVVGVTSKQPMENDTEYPFYIQSKLNSSIADYIIVTTGLDYYDQIRKQAQSIGYDKEKIISIIDLQTYNYRWTECLKRREINDLLPQYFSLFAENCCGGLLYHTLGRKFMSPMINTFMEEGDFIKFASNIGYYLSRPLELAGWEKGTGGKKSPYFHMEAVSVHFPHVYTAEKAVSLWETRKERVSLKLDDVGILMFTENKDTLQRFNELPYWRKVCVVNFDSDVVGALRVNEADFTEESLADITMAIARGKYPAEFKKMLRMMGG